MSFLIVFVEKNFSVEHCLSCPTGGFPAIRHNEVKDITAEMLTEVCSNVDVEPHLERLSDELLALRISISSDEGRLDISANGVWGGRFEKAFFDVRVFNPCAKSNSGTLPSVYRKRKWKNRDAMSNLSEKLNTAHSHLLFFRAGTNLLPHFIKDLLR